jgi:hypothetical protein
MSQKEFQLLQLQMNLSQYGLNPQDWILKPLSQMTYLIAHKEDPGFKFCGQWKHLKQKAAWQSLQLLSI